MASLKKVFLLFTMLIMTLAIMAQNNVITFQAVVRDANNRLVPNEAITVTIQVQNIGGDVLYAETDNVTSNANGLISTLIGDNNLTSFAAVNWNDAKIKTIVKVVSTGYEVESILPVNAVPVAIYSSDVSPAGSTITAVYNKMQQDSLALAQRITADSIALHKATKDSAAAISTALADTASAIRNSIGDGLLTITYGSESPVTFSANQKTDANIAIPSQISANNGKITITRSGESIPNGEFTLNQSDDQTINIVVPTKLSEMENDGKVYAKRDSVNVFTAANDFTGGSAKVPSQFDINNPPTTATCTQDAINICNLVAVFDSLTKRIDSISQAIEEARQEIEALRTLLVTTDSIPVSTIAITTAKAYGTVVFDGGKPNTVRGMLYSTSDLNLKLNATGVDSVKATGTGKGSYDCILKQLVPCTQYYVRAFAYNDVDTAYGDVMNFTTKPFTCGSTLTDIDGNEYGTLLLGSQCWMQQNLRTTHFADGTEIPVGGLGLANQTGARRYAPDNNLNTYGYLYNWDAAMNGSASSDANPSGVQGVCPDGWHLPSDAEWTQLTTFVASNSANVCDNNPLYIAKSLVSTEDWGSGAWSACSSVTTNNTGFSVLPAGTWHVNAALGHIDQGYAVGMAIFRTATVYEEKYVQAKEFYTENPYVDATAIDKTNGLSVRCVLTCPTDAAYLPTVSAVTLNATGATVSMTSNVLADGGATVTERGVCWSTSQHPTTSSTHKAASSAGTGSFTVSEDLTPGTTYYVRAYATNSEGTAYGAEVAYTTPMPKLSPTVNTGSKFIALMEGFEDSTLPSAWTTIDNDGDGNNWDIGSDPHSAGSQCILSRSWNGSALHPDNYLITPDISLPTGILSVLTFWHKGSGDPSFSNEQFMVKVGNIGASTVGDFTTLEPELTSSDEYVQKTVDLSSYAGQTIRLAFVHNDTDKEYLCIDDIVVGEDGAGDNIVSDVTATTATCGGYVSDDGGATVTARGVCWSTSPNPTVSDSHTTDGTGTGGFTSNITGLTVNTTYYVRAYAINSEGTTYGNQVSFKTLNRSLNITSDRAATIKMCGASSQTVTYTATPSNGDASDYTYSWSCSGGTISGTPTSNTATITYTSAATYTVSCTATHNTESFDVSKTATTKVESGGSPTYLGLCNEGLTITSHEEENNKNYRWAFANSISWGDGNSTTITSAQFSHTYAAPGIYTVTISSSGCDVNRTFALGDIVPHPCTVTNAHTNASTYTSSTGGLEAINAEGKVTTVADNDGNTYNVTQIGSQCWMAENLRTTKNPDGTTIAQGSSSTSSDASVAYRYDPVGGVSADPYGYFYNWTAVMNGESASSTNPSNVRGICPLGWHVPSTAEWDVMLTEVGTDQAAKLATGCDWKLDYSTSYYQAKSTPGDCAYPERNSTGFGALPAGTYIDADNYSKTANFWTTDASSSSSAKYYYFGYATSSVENNTTYIYNGYSLRCVRD